MYKKSWPRSQAGAGEGQLFTVWVKCKLIVEKPLDNSWVCGLNSHNNFVKANGSSIILNIFTTHCVNLYTQPAVVPSRSCAAVLSYFLSMQEYFVLTKNCEKEYYEIYEGVPSHETWVYTGNLTCLRQSGFCKTVLSQAWEDETSKQAWPGVKVFPKYAINNPQTQCRHLCPNSCDNILCITCIQTDVFIVTV